jgi:hypothetical protein
MNTSQKSMRERKVAYLSTWGTTIIHYQNPYVVALWSVAFPGYGHLLLNKYMRGFALIIWEIFINQKTNLNLAMVYSFTGQIDLAKEALYTNYMYLYIPLYIYSIWDSYRTTIEMNNIYYLNKSQKHSVKVLDIKPFEINYLEKKNPIVATIWSMTVPSVGQLYLHQIFSVFFTLVVTVVFIHFSHFAEGFHYLMQGNIQKSTEVLDKQWLFYMPSLYFFNVYETYIKTKENNNLYIVEQKMFLKQNFQSNGFLIKKGNKVT